MWLIFLESSGAVASVVNAFFPSSLLIVYQIAKVVWWLMLELVSKVWNGQKITVTRILSIYCIVFKIRNRKWIVLRNICSSHTPSWYIFHFSVVYTQLSSTFHFSSLLNNTILIPNRCWVTVDAPLCFLCD